MYPNRHDPTPDGRSVMKDQNVCVRPTLAWTFTYMSNIIIDIQ